MDDNKDTDKLNALLEPIITGMGFEVVRISFGGVERPILQVMAERPDGTMSIQDCTKLSREISTVMDVEDPILGNFDLEVSSPGMDRPLTRLKDFDRFSGFEAKVVLKIATDDRRRFRGIVLGTSEEHFLLRTVDTNEEFSFSLDDIQSAKLVITDELIKASQKKKQ
jgi:ribosome maturation factor RimP